MVEVPFSMSSFAKNDNQETTTKTHTIKSTDCKQPEATSLNLLGGAIFGFYKGLPQKNQAPCVSMNHPTNGTQLQNTTMGVFPSFVWELGGHHLSDFMILWGSRVVRPGPQPGRAPGPRAAVQSSSAAKYSQLRSFASVAIS